jgi:hypothetical protein
MIKYICCIQFKDGKMMYISHTSGDVWHTKLTYNKQLAKMFTRKSDATYRSRVVETSRWWYDSVKYIDNIYRTFVEEVQIEDEATNG